MPINVQPIVKQQQQINHHLPRKPNHLLTCKQQFNTSIDQPDTRIQILSNNHMLNNIKATEDQVEKINYSPMFEVYCINCLKQDQYCSECKQVINIGESLRIDENTIYCVIEKGELHEMQNLNNKAVTELTTNKALKTTTSSTTVTFSKK